MRPPIKEIRLTREVGSHRHQSVSVIRAGGHYGNSVALINKWVAIAKQTYPGLQDERIKVVQYGGDRYAGTFGIEFPTPGNGLTAPDGWSVIQELEKTS
jgi:hypothetical protein